MRFKDCVVLLLLICCGALVGSQVDMYDTLLLLGERNMRQGETIEAYHRVTRNLLDTHCGPYAVNSHTYLVEEGEFHVECWHDVPTAPLLPTSPEPRPQR